MLEHEDEWNSFMARVDQVGKVIKGLASKDQSEAERATIKANEILGPTNGDIEIDENCLHLKSDRTVINYSALQKKDEDPNTMTQEAFKRSVEIDAKQRAEERRLNKEVADRHMKNGNEAFRQQDYDKALCFYNKAIDSIKDSCLLYTNRALTHIKLGLNQRALEDAKLALFLNPNSLKGYLYKAQANYNLGNYEESDKIIKEACGLHPDEKSFIEGVQEQWSQALTSGCQ